MIYPAALDETALETGDANGTEPGDALLDWGESPIGPSELAVQRVATAARQLHRYPRGLLQEVTARTADHLGVAEEQVLLVAGVDEAVDMALTLVTRAWTVRPGFDGYLDRAAANGMPLELFALDSGWQPSLESVARLGGDDLVLVAQPNNPTGNLFGERWLTTVRQSAGYVFLDETYQEFSTRRSLIPQLDADPGLIVFRSYSKAMGLAGVRLGCLVANAGTVARFAPLRRFLPIDSISLHAVAGTLQDTAFIQRLIDYVLAQRPALAVMLRESAAFSEVRDTEANFVLAQLRPDNAVAVRAHLAADGIRVKECGSLGLPGWLRVSVGSTVDHRRLSRSLVSLTHTLTSRGTR